jgi:hypothetical protein
MDIERITRGFLRRLRKLAKHLRPGSSGPAMVSSHTLTDEAFLELFVLEEVQKHLSSGNVDHAMSALLDHYQNRTVPSWPSPPRTLTDLRFDLDKISQEELIRKANMLVDLRVTPDGKKPQIDSDGNIAWATNLNTTPEWLYRLNRHGWWPVLGLAYKLTGNEIYPRTFENQLLDWIKKCPPPSKISEKSPNWRLMEAALRMRVSWIPSFAIFLKSSNFSPEAKMAMLRSIYDHARFLSLFKTRLNHLLREINGLACVSVYFPEFREAKEWLDIALSRLEGEVLVQINPDGSHVEVSTGYQWLVLDELEAAYDLLKVHDSSSLAETLGTILKKMYELLVYVIRPDGTFPEINDGFLRWKHHRMVEAAKKFERSDFLFVGSDGLQGTPPAQCSKAFENAGWYVMRSGWSTDARYLFFDAGPHGGYHGHEDKLSIEVFAFGQSFVVDSGSYTYEKENPYRAYFVGSQGHNTVLVNGLSQMRRWMDEPPSNQKKPESFATWISNETCDYVSSCYAGGYGEFSLEKPKKKALITDVRHTRHVLFVKPDYWMLADEIEASHPYCYDILFHTPPGIAVKEAGNKQIILSKSDDGPGLRIIPAEPGNVEVSCVAGTETPIQGWYSVGHLKKTPSEVVIYRSDNRESVLLLTLLFPFRSGKSKEQVALKSLAVRGGDGKALMIEVGSGVDYLMLSRDQIQKQFGGHESSGGVCLIRTDREGQVLKRFDIPGIH